MGCFQNHFSGILDFFVNFRTVILEKIRREKCLEHLILKFSLAKL